MPSIIIDTPVSSDASVEFRPSRTQDGDLIAQLVSEYLAEKPPGFVDGGRGGELLRRGPNGSVEKLVLTDVDLLGTYQTVAPPGTGILDPKGYSIKAIQKSVVLELGSSLAELDRLLGIRPAIDGLTMISCNSQMNEMAQRIVALHKSGRISLAEFSSLVGTILFPTSDETMVKKDSSYLRKPLLDELRKNHLETSVADSLVQQGKLDQAEFVTLQVQAGNLRMVDAYLGQKPPRFEDAERIAKLLENYPAAYSQALQNIVRAYLGQKPPRFEDAKRIAALLNSNPVPYSQARQNIARAYFAQHRYTEAGEIAQSIPEKNIRSQFLHSVAVAHVMRQKEPGKAERVAQLIEDPELQKDARAHILKYYIATNDFAPFDQLLQLIPDRFRKEGLSSIVTEFLNQNDPRNALAAANRIPDPVMKQTRLRDIAIAFLKTNEPDAALKIAGTLEIPYQAQALEMILSVYLRKAKFDKAEEIVRSIRDPLDQDTQREKIIQAYLNQDPPRFADARRIADTIKDRMIFKPQAFTYIADAYLDQGKVDEAEQAAELISDQGLKSQMRKKIFEAYKRLENSDRAQAYAVRIQPPRASQAAPKRAFEQAAEQSCVLQ